MNNKGAGRFEVLTVIVLLLVVAAIMLTTILDFDVGKNEYDEMRELAYNFGKDIYTNADLTVSNSISLGTAINYGYTQSIESPFEKGVACDLYESKVVLLDGSYYVTLQCGEYLINNERRQEENYKIYKVGEWQEEEIDGQQTDFYNYKSSITGQEVFDKYYTELEFLSKFNEENASDYEGINMIPTSYSLVTKSYYRSIEVIEEK